jgi:CobQ-like glutamine amidotransferase family enzyme
MSLYLMGIYGDQGNRAWFEQEAADRGAKLDIGKSCVRFKALEDLPLDLVGDAIARLPVEDFIRIHEQERSG